MSDSVEPGRLEATDVPRLDPPNLSMIVGGLLRTMRPHQWVKNVFVLAPVVFAKSIFDPTLLWSVASAVAVFCVLAGAVYTMNDLVDVEADRQHPVKCKRPIASGRVPLGIARVAVGVLVGLGLGVAAFSGTAFFIASAAYFAQNVAYSFKLKNIAYLDVTLIASGFVLRVVAGGFATDIQVSGYLLECTALLALFLGFGKRRHELLTAESSSKQRAVLEAYSKRGLDLALVTTAVATLGVYFAYTIDTHTIQFFRTRYLWPTTIFVALGQWRFIHLVRTRKNAESPTQEMLQDGPFVGILLIWVMLVMWMVYNLRPLT